MDMLLDPLSTTLILSGVLVFTALIMWIIYTLVKSNPVKVSEEFKEPYLAGEPPTTVSKIDIPSHTLFWGFIYGLSRKLYHYLRERMHSGVLNEWGEYMVAYLGLLSLIGFLFTALILLRGG